MLGETAMPDGPFSPTDDNVTETGKLVYTLLNTPEDDWVE